MLKWAMVFFGVAVSAGAFGFGGFATVSTEIARLLFYIFLTLAIIAVICRLVFGN